MSQACTLAKEVASQLENDYNYELAIEFYQEAALLYETDNQIMYMIQMQAKKCDLTILIGNFKEFANIIKTYEKIAKRVLSDNLVKSQAKDYFFKSGLCFLANDDLLGAKNSLENYMFEDPSFEMSRQKRFLEGLVTAIENKDSDQLTAEVRENTRILSLDKVNTKLLVEIKKLHSPDDEPGPAKV